MLADWLREIKELKWAVGSLPEILPNGSATKEILKNAARGIESRLDWIFDQAKAETKREPR